MIRKKNSFLTFCFSLLPGAGQMYMGFMKRGVCLMSAFFLLIFFSSWLNLGPLMFILPVIWFYSFFDTHNLYALPDDEFYAMEDDYLIDPKIVKDKANILQSKYRNILAITLIIIGFSILWNNMYDALKTILPEQVSDFIWRIGHNFPQLAIGVAIIAFGLYLISGKKKDLDTEEKKLTSHEEGGF